MMNFSLQLAEAKWMGLPELAIWDAEGIQEWLDILFTVHPRAGVNPLKVG